MNDLADTAWEYASDDELLAALAAIEACSRRLHGVVLAVTAQVDSRGIAGTRGVTSTAVLLRQLLRISPRVARRRVADARQVSPRTAITGEKLEPTLPAAAAAIQAGTIDEQHLQIIRQTVEKLPPDIDHEVRATVESRLVAEAEHFDPVILGKIAYRIRAHLDPDGTLQNDKQAAARRELTFSPDPDGSVRLRGRLDTEGAATVQAALAPLAAPRPANADGTPDPRTPAHRRADALVQAARMLLDTGELPTQNGGHRPHLTVTIRLTDLTTNTNTRPDSATGSGTGTAELDGAGTITAGAARRIACDSSVVPVVLGARSEPLDVGRASYTVPAPMRRALIVRDRGCAFPGCDRPPNWCEAHHVVHWADGGPTKLNNLVLLCDYHHRVAHEQDWEIRIIDGHPEFIPPAWLNPERTPIRNTVHDPPLDTENAA